MADAGKRPLKVFLCHASGDKFPVREIYKRLVAEGVDAWLDEEKIMPGQDWQLEIPRAVREADVVVVCLSNRSITKEGYIQKELKYALDRADEKPDDTIFLIPARLQDCAVPERLSRWQWVDLFEEHGFARLLRSLKLRADNVGATVEPFGEESDDQEIERRLDHLYTEGLAAFYTEDWDRAYQRFQAILRERPNNKNAAEKLAQAERQRNFVKLYARGTDAYQAEDWLTAIQVFEDLLGKSGDYKDSGQLLRDAKKQKQLKELYLEAKRLHAAQKWHAVLKVFDQIAGIDSEYPDPEGMLTSAQKEAAEIKRLADLNDIYRQGVHKMDAGEWYEARGLLEQVHAAQAGFLDTERLLQKIEDEILRIEERRKRDAQVQMLYEQARKMVRTGQWGKAFVQMEEIRRLDNQFTDTEGLFEKSKAELAREEREAEQRRELAALYAEAVSLLEAKKYQEALEKWNTVQAMDSKYKDTSRVKTTAKRKLDELSRPEAAGQSWSKIPVRMAILVLLVIILIIIDSRDPTMYDDFNNPLYNGKHNTNVWNAEIDAGKITQGNGLLTFELNTSDSRNGLWTQTLYKPTYPIFIESRMMLETTSTTDAHIQVSFISETGMDNTCGIYQHASGADTPVVSCTSELEIPDIPQESYSTPITPEKWHLIRIELYPDTMTFVFFVDGNRIGAYISQNPDASKDLGFNPAVYMYSGADSNPSAIGYVDYVKIGKIEDRLFLADLEHVKAEVGAADFVVGKYPFSQGPVVEGSVLRAKNGEGFPYGLFAHAPSELRYSLPENAVTFSSSIYLGGYDGGCDGTAAFIVLLDDQEIYRSSLLRYSDPVDPVDISVSVQGGQMLTLITDPIDDGNDCDWTVWGDPYLILR